MRTGKWRRGIGVIVATLVLLTLVSDPGLFGQRAEAAPPTYHFHVTAATNPSTARVINTTVPTGGTQSLTQSASGTGEVMFDDWVVDNPLGLTTIPSGNWSFRIDGYASSSMPTGYWRVKVYTRSSGGVNTLQFTSTYTTKISTTSGTSQTWTYTQPSSIAISATDRLFIEVWVNRTVSASGSYYLQYDSSTDDSQLTPTFTPDTTGPASSSVSASPSPTNGSANVTLTANVSDAATGNNNIAAAEYYIDTDPGVGSGTAMSASDGAFNSPTESVTATISAATVNALSEGNHTIYVRGKDISNNWDGTASTVLAVDRTGPTTSSAGATPNPTVGSGSVTLTASVSDPLGGGINSNIAAAEWYTGTDPGAGNGQPMSASDGAFNSTTESVTTTISLGSWGLGNYTIYVRGKDAAGNWGGTNSTVLQVTTNQDVLSVTGQSQAPQNVVQGQAGVAMEMLGLHVDQGPAGDGLISLQGITVTLSGSNAYTDVGTAYVYHDANGNSAFDSLTDTQLGSGSIGSGKTGYVSFPSALTINTNTTNLFVVYDIAASAVPTDTVGATIAGTSSFAVASPETTGNVSGTFPIASGASKVYPAGTDFGPPTAPANLSGTALNSNMVRLSWQVSTDNVGAMGYTVWISYTGVITWSRPVDVMNGKVNWTDTGLTANTTYKYKVNARDAAGNVSADSNVVQVTTLSTNTFPHQDRTTLNNSCNACHSVFGSGGTGGGQKARVDQVCYVCHDGTGSGYSAKTEFNPQNDTDASKPGSSRTSYHDVVVPTSPTSTRNDVTCSVCHNKHGYLSPSASPNVMGARLLTGTHVGGATGTTTTATENFCYGCHSSTGDSRAYARGGQISATFSASAHNSTTGGMVADPLKSGNQIKCMNCHEPHASDNKYLVARFTGTSSIVSASNYSTTWKEEGLCQSCHKSGITGQKDIATQFTKTYKHPIAQTSDVHQDTEALAASSYSGSNRHVECQDCHSPHAAKAGNHTPGSSTAGLALTGVSGISVTNQTGWTAPISSTVTSVTSEYQLCFKCHSSWAYDSNPPLSHSGGITETDQSKEFNVNNDSYHYVEGDKTASSGSTPRTTGRSMGWATGVTWTATSQMTCTDCHASDTTGDPAGAHGSSQPYLLKAPWTSTTGKGSTSNDLCFKCHDWNTYSASGTGNNTGFKDTGGTNRHRYHMGKSEVTGCQSCHSAVPHGGQYKAILAPREVGTQVQPQDSYNVNSKLWIKTWKTSGTWTQNDCAIYPGGGH